MNGLLVVNKPSGMSSHGVVSVVRKITGEKRVGHSGTLDPMATGVLVLCLGHAVRVSEYLIDHDKTYRARVRLGVETDTYDATGEVVATRAVQVTPDAVTTALYAFVGKIAQKPPAHSAVQRDGVRAYQLARRGVAVEMAPRAVEIYSITVRAIELPEVEFDVHSSKGTYIRSLAHDLGERLGTGAHLNALTRLASGPFTLEQSLTLEDLKQVTAQGELARHLLPTDLALTQFSAVHLDAAHAWGVRNGQTIGAIPDLTTTLVRAYDEHGNLIGLLEREGDRLKPKKIFDAGTPRDDESETDPTH
ncbi:MAG: tRNA pseudouridine(55) synthase TruB [Anaerolineae bacterium]